MLDYTKTAWNKITEDFKRLLFVIGLMMQLVYIGYLIYSLVVGAGVLIANIFLLAVSSAYLIFWLIMSKRETADDKQTKKLIGKVFKRCKKIIKLVTLGIAVYGIYTTATNVTPLSVVITALMIVGWVLQALCEIVYNYVVKKGEILLEGLKADWESATKPAKAVGNFFKKLAGKEVEEPKPPSKLRLWLDEKVAARRVEKKEQKKQDKIDRKLAKRQAKLDKKAEKKEIAATLALPPANEDTEE